MLYRRLPPQFLSLTLPSRPGRVLLSSTPSNGAPLSPHTATTTPPKRKAWRRLMKFVLGVGVVGVVIVSGWFAQYYYLNKPYEGSTKGKPRLVVLGSGWAATSLLKSIEPGVYDIAVVSPRNYFLFTPLLPSSAVGTIETRSLVEPMRRIMRHVGATYFEAKARQVDVARKVVLCTDAAGNSFDVPYDKLVIGVGCKTNTFGTPGVEDNCMFLKEVPDARKIRHQIMECFEKAALPSCSDEQRRNLLHFVVVGGGPTGVEAAGELDDFIRQDLVSLFPGLVREHARVSLFDSNDHILNTYDAAISRFTERHFWREGISVINNARVVQVAPQLLFYRKSKLTSAPSTKVASVTAGAAPSAVVSTVAEPALSPSQSAHKLSAETFVVPFGMCIWATGIQTRNFITGLSGQLLGDKGNVKGLLTDDHLRVRGSDGSVFAAGDCSTVELPGGHTILSEAKRFFAEADKDNSRTLTFAEFDSAMKLAKARFPMLTEHLRKTRHLFDLYDVNHDQTIDAAEYEVMMQEIDKKLKPYPATAQVASQQGQYLARLLEHEARNPATPTPSPAALSPSSTPFSPSASSAQPTPSPSVSSAVVIPATPPAPIAAPLLKPLTGPAGHAHGTGTPSSPSSKSSAAPLPPAVAALASSSHPPFVYNHLGSFVYIGQEKAGIEMNLTDKFTLQGAFAFWLWRSAYFNQQVSLRTRTVLALDWTKTWLFGRDVSRY